MSLTTKTLTTSERISRWLRSPNSHEVLSVSGDQITSESSGFRGSIRDDVAVMSPEASESFFDDKFHVMKHGKENQGEWDFCYEEQTKLLSRSLKPGMLVLDIGCGPVLPYDKPEGVDIVGLEPSFHSIRVNRQVDLRVYGSAYAIPLANASVDAVVCFYAIHHMVGADVRETTANVVKAFAEFGRVLKPGGALFVFEMTPTFSFGLAQKIYWNRVKRMIGKRLDMRFFTPQEMETIGKGSLPKGSTLVTSTFETSPFTTFAPIFSLPKVRVPRFVYPLSSILCKWQIAPV
jgi:ubiquinone/menaquinone biosynthesis C-methylase UbiE